MNAIKRLCLIALLAAGLVWGTAFGQTVPDTLTLQQCLETAERLNPDLGYQKARVSEAEAKTKQQWGALLPQVDANLNYYRYHEQLPSKRALFGPSLDDYYAEVGLKQALFNGGKYYYALRSAQAAAAAEKSKFELVRRQTQTAVRKAYYELARTIMSVSIQRDLVARLGEQFRVAELLYAGGKVSNVDVLRVETQLEIQKDNLDNLEQLSYARALGLGQAVGLERPVWPKDMLAEPAVLARPGELCVRECFKTNPELAAAQSGIEKARGERSSVRGDLLPSVSLRLNYNREDKELFPGHPNWYAGVVMNVPLFKGGTVLSQIRQAGHRITQAEQSYRKTELSLSLRFQTFRASYLDKLNRLKTIRRIVELSRQTLLAAEVRYGAGKLSAVELFDAQSAWAASEQNYINTLAEMLSASAELEGLCPNDFNNNEVKP